MLDIINNLKYFFEDCNREISVREFGRMKNVSPATASKILKNLEKENILLKRNDRGYLLFRLNTENFVLKNLSSIYWSEKLNPLLEELDQFYSFPTIILFGSINKCENNLNSDIDLAIFTEKKTEFPHLMNFEKKINREIQLFNFGNFESIKNKNLAKNILNGTKLSGEIEWI